MIYFDKILCEEAKQIIDTKDYIDLVKDLSDIDEHLNVLNINPTHAVIISAKNLDAHLLGKYPIITKLLEVGNKMSTQSPKSKNKFQTLAESLKSNLTQDYFGILCHVLIKKDIIKTVEQFIDHVD